MPRHNDTPQLQQKEERTVINFLCGSQKIDNSNFRQIKVTESTKPEVKLDKPKAPIVRIFFNDRSDRIKSSIDQINQINDQSNRITYRTLQKAPPKNVMPKIDDGQADIMLRQKHNLLSKQPEFQHQTKQQVGKNH